MKLIFFSFFKNERDLLIKQKIFFIDYNITLHRMPKNIKNNLYKLFYAKTNEVSVWKIQKITYINYFTPKQIG